MITLERLSLLIDHITTAESSNPTQLSRPTKGMIGYERERMNKHTCIRHFQELKTIKQKRRTVYQISDQTRPDVFDM